MQKPINWSWRTTGFVTEIALTVAELMGQAPG